MKISFVLALLLAAQPFPAWAHPPDVEDSNVLPDIVVVGRAEDLVGVADSAAQGTVGEAQLSKRPLSRTGEVLESVPGLIATQHSGTGKANQYFLRGFNLDHGTDFSVAVDNVPMNLPTHAHGQGYLDMAGLIPEMIHHIDYKKGPYYSEVGDFSSAGAADIHYVNRLDAPFVKIGVGEDHFFRSVAGVQQNIGDNSRLIYAFDGQHQDGPWDREENYKKFSGFVKFASGSNSRGSSLTLTGTQGEWDATDQIPQRAVDSGVINRLGNINPTVGGTSARTALVGNYWNDSGRRRFDASAFASYYRLNLYSDFTYFLDDPVNGDQFEQKDRRIYTGGAVSQTWRQEDVFQGVENTVGLQVRHDNIPTVGLFHTQDRNELNVIREDAVKETSGGIYVRNQIRWLSKFRSILGLRGDAYYFDVHSKSGVPENAGHENDQIVSPKIALIFGPWADTEFYLNGGTGFHSNDARGTTTKLDPGSSTPVDPVNPLVRSKGAEVGMRTSVIPNLRSTLTYWLLDLDSELLFVGDAGTNEPNRPSRRKGVEFANYYSPRAWLTFEGDLSLSSAKFRDSDPVGDEIPGSVERVVSGGVVMDFPQGPFGALRVRHFGPRPLIEDNSVRSEASTLWNLQLGYRVKQAVAFTLDVLNLFDSESHDIDYFYASQLAGEGSPVDDRHFHPAEPRTVRFYTTVKF